MEKSRDSSSPSPRAIDFLAPSHIPHLLFNNLTPKIDSSGKLTTYALKNAGTGRLLPFPFESWSLFQVTFVDIFAVERVSQLTGKTFKNTLEPLGVT